MNISAELMPCPILSLVMSLPSVNKAATIAPINVHTKKAIKKMNILMPVDCFMFFLNSSI